MKVTHAVIEKLRSRSSRMEIYAIVQVRMTSQRFPGKALRKVEGKPLITFLLERINRCYGIDKIVIATSTDKSDDPINDYCITNAVTCHRGSLNNVSERFNDIIKENNIEAFVRLSGDSPLIDQEIIDKAASLFRENDYDIVTNVLRRTYPKGQSVEVLGSSAFLKAFSEIKKEKYCEHITTYFYDNKENYKIHNFVSSKNVGDVQLSVDTKDDMNVFEQIVARMDRPHWQYNWEEVLSFHNCIPEFK